MKKDSNIRLIILPFIIGIVLGIIAKFADGRDFMYYFPVFADIMGRFGIWVWAAAIISIRSKTALFAAVRSFVFFIGMLSAYYGYTVLFLKFFPKPQVNSLKTSCLTNAFYRVILSANSKQKALTRNSKY